MSNTKISNFSDFLCPNFLLWMLLIKRMHRLPRNVLQHTPASFRGTKSIVLDFRGTPSYLFFKSTNQNNKIFVFHLLICLPDFSSVNMKLQQLKLIPPPFEKLLKFGKSMRQKLRAVHRICLKWTVPRCSILSFTFLKLVRVAAPNTTYAPTFEKYVARQPIVFQVH